MKTLQIQISGGAPVAAALAPLRAMAPDLVLCFGAQGFFRGPALHAALKADVPSAVLAGCSGAGEILDAQVHDGTLALTALKFDRAHARGASTRIDGMAD